jgi:hypothetical protein
MKQLSRLYLACFIFILSACSQLPDSNSWDGLSRSYKASIDDAAVIEAQEIAPVMVINDEEQRFVTWTNYPSSFPVDKDVAISWGELWVTLDNQVQQHCRAFSKDKRDLRIQQLLGLPPQKSSVERSFVVLTVNTADVFRPCANPSLADDQCSAMFPDDVSEAHKAWYAGQTALAYQAQGYPWTRLGYTYNWNPNADEVGVNEFVIRRGANVKVESVTPTVEYCQ